jgi:hypothetical protein
MQQKSAKVSFNPFNWSTPAKAALCASFAFSAASLGLTTIAAMQRHERLACENAVKPYATVPSATQRCGR